MIKAKWLYSELPVSLVELSRLLLNEQYNEEKGSGFILSRSDNAQLEGKYIERSESISTTTDPFGNESEQLVVNYYMCKFSMIAESQLMCVIDPPRSLRKFITKLHNILGLGFILSDIIVNPLDWADSVAKRVGKITVTHISSSGIRTGHGGLAKISVSSKKDSREDFNDMVDNRRHSIDTVKFELKNEESQNITCEMTRFAIFKVKGYGGSELVQKLRRCLQEVVNG